MRFREWRIENGGEFCCSGRSEEDWGFGGSRWA